MARRPDAPAATKDKRRRVDQSLLAAGWCPKNTLASMLRKLNAEGLLADGFGHGAQGTIRQRLQHSIEAHGKSVTSFGNVEQSLDLGLEDLKAWPFIHPYALLDLLVGRVPALASILSGLKNQRMKLILYIDEYRPGNVLRPDAGRATQAVYWTFSNLPDMMLVRSAAWFTFGVLQSKYIPDLKGGVSGFTRQILRVFFPSTGPSMRTGILLGAGKLEEPFVLAADFATLIADDKGHKEVWEFKGASGTKLCMTCQNIVQFVPDECMRDRAYPLYGIDCDDPTLFIKHTNSSIFKLLDRMRTAKEEMGSTAYDKLEQVCGFCVDWDNGLLSDPHLRAINVLKPIDQYYRDWMHITCVNGLGQIEMFQIVKTMQRSGVPLDSLHAFAKRFVLPVSLGKVDDEFFTTTRFPKGNTDKKDLNCFSAEVLTYAPIILEFANSVAQSLDDAFRVQVTSFRLLCELLDLCSRSGPSKAMQHMDRIEMIIGDHNKAFVQAYNELGLVRPKFHQLFHVPGLARKVGKLLSCFVTERKHRSLKQTSASLFRFYEKALTSDVLNRLVAAYTDETGNLLRETYLVTPIHRVSPDGRRFESANALVGPCGQIHKEDLILLNDASSLGVVKSIFSMGSDLVLKVCLYEPTEARDRWLIGGRIVFAEVDSIDCAVAWTLAKAGVVKIILPASIGND